MNSPRTIRILLTMSLIMAIIALKAQDQAKSSEIYGFIMMDAGYNANQIHPDWFDVVRPTKLPTFENQYGTDGNFYFSVRQTRLGFKNYFPTSKGDLFTQFEFEMFGTGVDAGQTTIRLRHAYAELGQFGVGQYWSPFMDIDVFPNTVEYWGPNGMAFFRNVQFRWMPIKGDTRLTFALERPGASADQGSYAGRIELSGVRAKFALPDLSFEYRKALGTSYVEIAGIARSMAWEDQNGDAIDLSGSAVGWGLNLSTNIKIGTTSTIRAAVVYGAGVQNYMNDAPVDVAIKTDAGSPGGIKGVALPMLGISAFLDHNWSEKFSSAIGYSSLSIQNTDGQTDDAYHMGQYIVGNLMSYPVKNAMAGIEVQYGNRQNFRDNATPGYLYETSILKVQFSFKYNFSEVFYRK